MRSTMNSVHLLLACLASFACHVAGHGFVDRVMVGKKSYSGYNPIPGRAEPGVPVAWTYSAPNIGFVSKDSYTTGDIICHRSASPAKNYVQVAAGQRLNVQWWRNTTKPNWPFEHKGPVMDYLAPCNGDCTTVDKTKLKFIKIAQSGLLVPNHRVVKPAGYWATNQMMDNNSSWTIQIPTSVGAGTYVLRHELLAFHYIDDVQHYPQCININVTTTSSDVDDSIWANATYGQSLYSVTDPDLTSVDIYNDMTSWPLPGPALIAGGQTRHPANDSATGNNYQTNGTGPAKLPALADNDQESNESLGDDAVRVNVIALDGVVGTGAPTAASTR